MLEVREVAVESGGKIIVKRANLSVYRGETVLLMGPNASGKSSLLKAIAGHPRYSIVHGSVYLDGEDITHLSAKERVAKGLALALQNPPILRGVTVRTLLHRILKRRGMSETEIEREIARIAKLLAIESLLDREFGRGFSGGELKRVEIATLMALKPRIALIDEPDSGVDVDSVLLIATAIDDMAKHGVDGMVVVTHSGLIARHITHSRAYIMLDGYIVHEGSSSEILNVVLSKGFTPFKQVIET